MSQKGQIDPKFAMELISLVLSPLRITESNRYEVLYRGLDGKRLFSCYFCVYIIQGFCPSPQPRNDSSGHYLQCRVNSFGRLGRYLSTGRARASKRAIQETLKKINRKLFSFQIFGV